MKCIHMLLVALGMFPGSIFAQTYSDFYVIPVAGHTAGAFGTMWASDVAIQNFHTIPLTVSLLFVESGQGRFDNLSPLPGVTIPAGGSALMRDVARDVRGGDNVTGAILIGADRPFAVTSRAYDAGRGVGQAVPATHRLLATARAGESASATAYLPGLRANAGFRSNLGFVASTDNGAGEMVVRVIMRDASGGLLGVKLFAIGAGGTLQHVQISASEVTTDSFDIGSAEFQIASGSGAVIPYASVVDNITADGVFISGQFPPDETATARAAFRSLFEAAWRR